MQIIIYAIIKRYASYVAGSNLYYTIPYFLKKFYSKRTT